MAYIEQDLRLELNEYLGLASKLIKDPEVLNYAITKLILKYKSNPNRYEDMAAITGVLENVKQEYYRRVIAKYEDKKIKQNGDIY